MTDQNKRVGYLVFPQTVRDMSTLVGAILSHEFVGNHLTIHQVKEITDSLRGIAEFEIDGSHQEFLIRQQVPGACAERRARELGRILRNAGIPLMETPLPSEDDVKQVLKSQWRMSHGE